MGQIARWVPPFTAGGLTRPPLALDDDGNVILIGEAVDFATIYGLKSLYLGLPATTPFPPVGPSPRTIFIPPEISPPPIDTPPTPPNPPPIQPPVVVTPDPPPASPVPSQNGSGHTAPAFTFAGITRPELHFDGDGNIILDPQAAQFVATYGIKFLYLGLPTSTPYPPVAATPPSVPVDSNAAANVIIEGASANSSTGLTAASVSLSGQTIVYSLTADSSSGGFKIDGATGIVAVADPSKIDFETAANGAYQIDVRASDGVFATSQSFKIAVANAAPSTPIDSDARANVVAEGAAIGTVVGITAVSSDVNGPAVTYSLTADSSTGGFALDAMTGIVSVADPSKLDYESSGVGHSYTITVVASDGRLTTSQDFTIGVTNVAPSTPTDANNATNIIPEGSAANTLIGLTASSSDLNGPNVVYSLVSDSSNGGFKIDAVTGVVSVADPSKIDYESSGASHSYSVVVASGDGVTTTTQTFVIGVSDIAPSTPTDVDGATNTVTEGAPVGTIVGIVAASSDINGGTLTYKLTADSSNGGFAIDPSTGVVTVADASKIDYESAPGHAYSVTAQASDGTLSSSQTFTVNVADVLLQVPTDTNTTPNTVLEGASAGSLVGLTASARDPNGPTTVYSLTSDSSGGGFAIDASTGIVTVANPNLIDYETAPGHAYSVTVQANDGLMTTSRSFAIAVGNAAPITPVDADNAINSALEGAANGSLVGITAVSTDVNGPAVIWSLIDSAGGRFAINSNTGVVTVANGAAIDFETAPGNANSYSITAQASDGAGGVTSQTFSIGVVNVNEAPVNAVPGAQIINEDTDLVFNSASGNAVTISDVDLFAGDATMTLSVASGTLTLGSVSGLTSVTNNNTSSVTLTGTATNINAALDGLVYRGNLNFNGGDTLTIYTSDNGHSGIGGPLTDSDTVAITVNAVNDAPVNALPVAQSVNEDTDLIFGGGNAITISDVDVFAGDATVTLSVTSGTLALGSIVGLTSISNNNTSSVTLIGAAANINAALDGLTYRGNLNFNGDDTLTIVTSDNGHTGSGGVQSDSDTVAITVNAVNDAPVNAVPGAQIVAEDTDLVFANANAVTVSDVDLLTSDATVTLSVASGTLALGSTANLTSVLNNNTSSVTLTGTAAEINAALSGLTYRGNANFNGNDTLTIVTSDNGHTGSGGAQSDTDTVAITVNAVNDAPVNSVPVAQSVNEDTDLVFAGANAIAISDVDLLTGDATVTLSVASGTLLLGSLAGLTSVTNNGTSSVILTGTATNINAALNGLTYRGSLNFNGGDTLTIDTSDNGHTGSGGPLTDSDTVAITVNAVNDAPVNAVPGARSVMEDTNLVFNGLITISDVDLLSSDATVTLSVTNGTLALGSVAGLTSVSNNNTSSVALTGTAANINAALNGLTYRGNLNCNGDDTLTIVTSDNGHTGSGGAQSDTDTVAITVDAVNDAPVNAVPSAQTVNEDNNLVFAGPNAITISDVDLLGSDATVTLSVASGTLALGSTANLTSVLNNNTSSVTLTGTALNINAALSGLTYRGNSNFNGNVTLTVVTGDNGHTGSGGAQSDTDTVAITVNAVNDAPAGTTTSISSVGPHTFVVADFGFSDPNDTPANGFASVLISPPSTGTLMLGTTQMNAPTDVSVADIIAGQLVFTPTGNATATIDFHVRDDGGTALGGVDTDPSPNTLTLIQNTPPIASDDSVAAVEAGSVAGIDPSGNVITATGAAGAVADTDNETPNGLIVVGVKTGAEGSMGQVAGTVGQALIGQYGTLTLNSDGSYVYVVDQTNTTVNALTQASTPLVDRFNYTLQDPGGLQDIATFSVSISGVNDAPVITSDAGGPTATVSAAENQTAVTTVTATDPDLPAQTLTYAIVGGADELKFAIGASSGVLTFQSAPNYEAPTDVGAINKYVVQVQVTDSGNPNITDVQTITVNVTNVNEAPTTNAVIAGGNEDAASIAITLTGSDPDASSGDTIASYTITNLPTPSQGVLYSDSSLSPASAVVSGQAYGATLYFVPAANFNGQVTFSAAAKDSHGLPDPSSATETINIAAVNDAPTAVVPLESSVGTAFSHTDLAITGLSVADIDAGSANMTATISAPNADLTFNMAGLASFTNNGTSLVTLTGTAAQLNTALATLTYKSDDGFTGADTVTLSVNDNGNSGSGGSLGSGNHSFRVGVVPQAFVIDNTPAGAGNVGTVANPFSSIASFNSSSADGSGDYIYINSGTYSEADGINLSTNQHVYGQGQTLQFTNPVTGQIVVVGTGSSGATPTISVTGANQHGVDLATGNEVRGLNVVTTLGNQTGIHDGNASVGNLSVSDVDVTGVGQAVDLTNGGALDVTIDTLSSTGATAGPVIHLAGTATSGAGLLSGNFAANAGSINLAGSTSGAFYIGAFDGSAGSGGTAAITYAGGITSSNGSAAAVIADRMAGAGNVTLSGNINYTGTNQGIIAQDNSGGNITFSGTSKIVNSGSNNAVNLANNTGATINFTNGGLDIDTTNGNGLIAAGGGTVNVTGTGNSITSTVGTALNVTNTTIGASGITFQSISSNGASNGILLNNTGSSGGLTVTGTGTTAGSGGTIQNSTGDGVKLTDTQNVSLANMKISDNAGNGINGLRVNGVTLTRDTLNSNADSTSEYGIQFKELTGDASHATAFNNIIVSNSFQHNVSVINSGGTLANLVVNGSTFSNDGGSGSAGSDFIFEADAGGLAGLPTMTLTANGNTFSGNNAYNGLIPGTGLFVVANDGTVNAHIGDTTGNTFDNLNNAINLTQSALASAGTGGNLNFTVKNNTVTRSDSTAINVFSSGDLARTLDGIIQGNVVGTQGVATSGSRTGSGIRIGHEALGVAKVLIDGNIVQSISVANVSGGDSIDVVQAVYLGTVHATVTNNIIRDNADSGAIRFSATTTGTTLNADAHGNTITNVNGTGILYSANGLGGNVGTMKVPQANDAAIEAANGGASAFETAAVMFNQPAPLLPAATPQVAAQGQGPGGAPELTAALLAPIVTEAIAHWVAAGATPAQIALLTAAHFTIADLSNGILGNTNAHGIQIDADAAGWGWFVDPTPADNAEYNATSRQPN